MTIPRIVETFLNTPSVQGTRLELAALAAQGPKPDPDAVDEVAKAWSDLGGVVER